MPQTRYIFGRFSEKNRSPEKCVDLDVGIIYQEISPHDAIISKLKNPGKVTKRLQDYHSG